MCKGGVALHQKFIEPMGYEMSIKLIEGYTQIILEYEQDTECPRWGTYDENLRIVESELYSKESKNKVVKERFYPKGMCHVKEGIQ